ncbi:site-specific integrase [Anaerolentibacter hominis]|uniref:tyrosine-type recombinase/integrase n=1 Tax=Anaerolentibacter hominis TaxID=3079009 RepID=UPI0031B8566D
MPRKGENIFRRKDGRWEGRYIKYYDAVGKAKYGFIYGKTYQEVKRKKLYMTNPGQPAVKKKTASVTLADISDVWLEKIRSRVKETSYVKYHTLINNHIKPFLGKYPAEQISHVLIDEFIDTLLACGRKDKSGGLSEKSIQDILSILRSILTAAARQGHMPDCDINRIRLKTHPKTIRILTQSEQQILEQYLKQDMDQVKLGVLLCLYTGLRLGELCALRWEDISLQDSVLKIRRTMQRIQNLENNPETRTRILIGSPKSANSSRDIPIPSCILPFIRRSSPYIRSSFFLTNDPVRYMEPRAVQYRFSKYVKDCGLNDVHFHTLRHTFATRCVESGFEIKSLSEILGHATVNITLNRYMHSSLELKRMNMDRLCLF